MPWLLSPGRKWKIHSSWSLWVKHWGLWEKGLKARGEALEPVAEVLCLLGKLWELCDNDDDDDNKNNNNNNKRPVGMTWEPVGKGLEPGNKVVEPVWKAVGPWSRGTVAEALSNVDKAWGLWEKPHVLRKCLTVWEALRIVENSLVHQRKCHGERRPWKLEHGKDRETCEGKYITWMRRYNGPLKYQNTKMAHLQSKLLISSVLSLLCLGPLRT